MPCLLIAAKNDLESSSLSFEAVCMIMWRVWKDRNSLIHNGKHIPAGQIWKEALEHLVEFQKTKTAVKALPVLENPPSARWMAPEPGELKLNTDASVSPDLSWCGLGGVIRNSFGDVEACFIIQHPSRLSPFLAECLALETGLQFALSKGLRISRVETDSLLLIESLKEDLKFADYGAMVCNIKRLLDQVGAKECKHVLRSANEVADALAHSALRNKPCGFWCQAIPYVLSNLL